jgi:predicted dehydrogenase
MKIRILGEVYDLPPPVPAADEAVVATAKVVTVPLARTDAAEPTFSLANIRKVLFFVFREGVPLTVAKIRAILSKRKLTDDRALVIAIGADLASGRPALALGGQDCAQAEQLCFPRSLTTLADDGADDGEDLEAQVPALLAWCDAHPRVASALRAASRHSGRPPGVTLDAVLAEGRRLLDAGAAPGVWTAEAVRFDDTPASAPAPAARPLGGKRSALFLAGAGTYPCAYALPAFARAGIPFDTVIEINPARAALVAKKFGFAHADTDAARGLRHLADYEAPLLVVATYHSTHMEIADLALSINPATRILLEKPPVATLDQLRRLERHRRNGAYVEIGYNRRHIPMTAEARKRLATQDGPMTITCIAKIPRIPPTHWYFWPAQRSRITGNACHWLDVGRYFIKAAPERLTLVGPDGGPAGHAESGDANDPISIVVSYADGSRLVVVVTDCGNSLRGVQEFIELRRGDMTVTIDDFLRMRVQADGRQSFRRRLIRDKGHDRMYARFVENVRDGRGVDYPDDDLAATSTQYLLASEALMTGETVKVIDLRAAAVANVAD